MPMRPVAPGERIAVLDALRGAALFGIIAANMRGFSGPLAAYFDHTVMWTDPTNRVAQALREEGVAQDIAAFLAFYTDGCLGRARQLAKEDMGLRKNQWINGFFSICA